MTLRLLIALSFFIAAPALAQSAPDGPVAPGTEARMNPVPFTPAAERLDGYDQRQVLLDHSLVGNVPFRNVGPRVMSGRVVDLDASPTDPASFYVAYASGGLWRTQTRTAPRSRHCSTTMPA